MNRLFRKCIAVKLKENKYNHIPDGYNTSEVTYCRKQKDDIEQFQYPNDFKK